MNKIPSRGVAVISNRTVCGVFYFKPAMFGEKRFLADPLRCCGLLFDTFDRLSKPVYIRQTVDYHPFLETICVTQ